MIHTIRKHSKWLLYIIAGATIFSMVYYIGFNPTRGGSGASASVNTNEVGGVIYGEKVTPELYESMSRDVNLMYLFNQGQWPDRQQASQDDLLRLTYFRMLFVAKAEQLGIHVSDAQAAQMTAKLLSSPKLVRALNVNSESVPMNAFVNQILAPAGMDENDLENFARNELVVEQLQQVIGLPGQLITPQEAAAEYVRQYREYSTEVVFFSATNYMGQISISPEDVAMYYTNYMADYRLPDRRQVSYVLFSSTNYLAEAQKGFGTNLEVDVDNAYTKYGMRATPDAKTPEESKAEMRKIILRQAALQYALTNANNFAQTVFNVSGSANKPASSQDLVTVARQEGLKVDSTQPFTSDYGPAEFTAPPAFTQTAFGSLTPDSPISEPVASPEGVYVIALDRVLPSEIPPLDEISMRVGEDLRFREATLLAQRAGTNFVRRLMMQMATGKSFAAAGVAEGLQPQVLPPFSLMGTEDLSELGDHATMSQLRQAAFTTPVGSASRFQETSDGGFVLFVASRPAIDESKMTAELPEFTEGLRERRSQDAFNQWLQAEGSIQLRDTPLARLMGAR